MDDYNKNILNISQNEWCSRIVYVLTPQILEGFRSIFMNAYAQCKKSNELTKYLSVFQQLCGVIPKWNETTITSETNKIISNSNCAHLEDMLSCMHILQLKLLSTMRVGHTQKQIHINIPKLSTFIHDVYINCARELYKYTYLYEILGPEHTLQKQRNNHQLELLVQNCIIYTVRNNIPISKLLDAYLSENMEEVLKEETIETPIETDEDVQNDGLLSKEELNEKMHAHIRNNTNELDAIVNAPTLTTNSINSVTDNDMPISTKMPEIDELPVMELQNKNDNDNNNVDDMNIREIKDPLNAHKSIYDDDSINMLKDTLTTSNSNDSIHTMHKMNGGNMDNDNSNGEFNNLLVQEVQDGNASENVEIKTPEINNISDTKTLQFSAFPEL